VGAYGSAVIRYTAPAQRVLYASAMVRMQGQPIAYHLDGSFRDDDPGPGSRNGIWWLPRSSVEDCLILTNYGNRRLQTTLLLYDAGGKSWSEPLNLAPWQTDRLSVRSLLQQAGWSGGEYGGFKIEMAKDATKLGALHVLYDQLVGFSALMKTFGYDPTATLFSRSLGGVKEWTTRAPMLALTEPDPALALPAEVKLQPRIFLHNTSAKSYTAHIRFNWRSATESGKTAPIDLSIKPNETQLVDVAALQTEKLIPADANWASVILSAPIQPDELMAVATSFDATGRYGAQTPFNDQLASQWEAGMWEVDSAHNSLVTIGNGGDKQVRAELTIHYDHGTEHYRVEQMLAPEEQMLVDFGQLIRGQVADSDGHRLPSDVMEGTYTVKDLSDRGRGGLYEGKVIVEKTYGHAHYGCAECCGINPEAVSMLYDPLGVGVGASFGQTAQAPMACDPIVIEDITGDLPNWWSGNDSISTVHPAAQVNGIAAGTTKNFAAGEVYAGEGHAVDDKCPQNEVEPGGTTNVQPTITSFDPNPIVIGANNATLTINGSGFGTSPTVKLPPGITFNGRRTPRSSCSRSTLPSAPPLGRTTLP